MMKYLFFLAPFILIFQNGLAQTIDTEQSIVTFAISNMGVKTVEGKFDQMSGTVQFDNQDLDKANFDVCISAGSVNTENKKRDDHLRKEDFFYVEKYPKICFQSKNISATADGYMAKGTLTMRGISKEVSIPFTFSNNRFEGTLTVQRKDYKIGPNGGFMVGKTVDLKIVCVVK